jgi:hypothetical protein
MVGNATPLRKIEELEALVRARPGGAALLEDLRPHAAEASYLVQRNRRVSTVWQRNGGPALIRALVDSGFDERVQIPASVGEATLETLLLAMADALQRHGSIELRRAIAGNAHEMLSCSRQCRTLAELLDALAAARVRRVPEQRQERGVAGNG